MRARQQDLSTFSHLETHASDTALTNASAPARILDQYHITLRFPHAARIQDELTAEDCATVIQFQVIRGGLRQFPQIYGECTLRGRSEKLRRSKQREWWLLRLLLRIEPR